MKNLVVFNKADSLQYDFSSNAWVDLIPKKLTLVKNMIVGFESHIIKARDFMPMEQDKLVEYIATKIFTASGMFIVQESESMVREVLGER